MYPAPPQFFDQKTFGNEQVGQDYWIVANGIRLTGMPGYKPTLSEEQLWQVSQFVINRGKLPEGRQRCWRESRIDGMTWAVSMKNGRSTKPGNPLKPQHQLSLSSHHPNHYCSAGRP